MLFDLPCAALKYVGVYADASGFIFPRACGKGDMEPELDLGTGLELSVAAVEWLSSGGDGY